MKAGFSPSQAQLGDRTFASVRADVEAFTSWVGRLNVDGNAGTLRAAVKANQVVLFDVEDGLDMLVARVVLREGRWHLQWADRNDRWHAYDDAPSHVREQRPPRRDQSYLTLAIPMQLIEEDVDGVFWG